MYKDKIINLISQNGIREDALYQKMYFTLVLGVFEAICKDIKKQKSKTTEKEVFRKHTDKIVATKLIVKKYVGCVLSEEEYRKLSILLTAFFKTGDRRKTFSKPFIEHLLISQSNKCAICNTDISYNNSHLDHIVPFDYVGDNLSENYQMLCITCNERKGNSTYFEMSMLLLNKSGY